MMEAFFKDLVCHGGHNDSMADSSSDGGDSPRGTMQRSSTMVMASASPQGHRSRASERRSLKKQWGAMQNDGQIPVWEDVDDAITAKDGLNMDDFIDPKVPTITRIPKHQRLSFCDENEGINTVRANYDPDADRCKAMYMATKQAALREEAAREVLNAPPRRSPALGRTPPKSPDTRAPTPPKKGKKDQPVKGLDKPIGLEKLGQALGFGSSSSRLPAPPSSSRGSKRCETPEPKQRHPSQGKSLPQRPPGPPPSNNNALVGTPRRNNAMPPPSPSPQQSMPPASPMSARRQVLKSGPSRGPSRCPSNAALNPPPSSSMGRSASQGRFTRSNSYMQSSDSFTLSNNQNGAWTYRGGPESSPMGTARNLRSMAHSSSQSQMQTNSYVPPASPQSNSYVPPPKQQQSNNSYAPPPMGSPMAKSNSYIPQPPQSSSYVPPPSSPMLMSSARPGMSPEVQYPNSIERIRDAGMAMCAKLFAPPPRMLSFDPTTGLPANVPPLPTAPMHAAPQGPLPTGPLATAGPRRMSSCEQQSGSSPFMALPNPLPTNPFATIPPPIGFAHGPFPQRMNSYDPPFLIHH